MIRDYRPLVQKQLEQIRPTGLQRVKRVQDGDELDLNAIIEARQDLRAGQSPDERFYSRKERMHRDVCAVFLVDLSASTDDPIEKSEPKPLTKEEQEMIDNLRDPWDAITADELVAEEPKRKIIDVQREAMVVMASALDALVTIMESTDFLVMERIASSYSLLKSPMINSPTQRFGRSRL